MCPKSEKLFYQIALTQINGVGDITARNLLRAVGDEKAIFKSSKKSLLSINGISAKLVEEVLSPEVLKKAEKELEFVERNNIKTYFINQEDYPNRLKECNDAPILLYFKGDTNLNTKRIVSIVGTRSSSSYGNSFCNTFLEELSFISPDTLIVSGLAYGIDINAHRNALKYNMPTIGVLAHGLDRIYPSAHRQTAIEMMNNGGLLTEFPSATQPDRFNFIRRNRIVAGMADAVIVVESDTKGGALITAEIANSYCKDVFAVPGKVTDIKSAGCNKLITNHKADLLISARHFVEQMNWSASLLNSKGTKQFELFTELTKEEKIIVEILSKNEALHINRLSVKSEIPLYQLFSTLLGLEIRNIVKNLPGNQYTLS